MRTGTQTAPTRPSSASGETGSAYIAVLLVLIVLTILGLALSLITQTEMQIGGNERIVNRVFYAADSGLEIAKVQVLVSRDFNQRTYTITDTGAALTTGTPQYGTRVTVAQFAKVQEGPCNLCEINQAGAYGAKDFAKTTYYVESTAARFTTVNAGTDRQPLAQKTISGMFELQPFEKIVVDPEASR